MILLFVSSVHDIVDLYFFYFLCFQSQDEILYDFIYLLFAFYFFFQAEDGIRDDLVTGVQTCALPILGRVGIRQEIEPILNVPMSVVISGGLTLVGYMVAEPFYRPEEAHVLGHNVLADRKSVV